MPLIMLEYTESTESTEQLTSTTSRDKSQRTCLESNFSKKKKEFVPAYFRVTVDILVIQ